MIIKQTRIPVGDAGAFRAYLSSPGENENRLASRYSSSGATRINAMSRHSRWRPVGGVPPRRVREPRPAFSPDPAKTTHQIQS